MKLYYFIGVLLRPFATLAFFLFGHITHTPRVRVVVQNERNELLLVKNWLSSHEWSLPGGGVNRGEEPPRAAQRELEEEVGLVITTGELKPLFTLSSVGHNEVVYALKTQSGNLIDQIPNKFEIKEMRWFNPTELPKLNTLTGQALRKMDLKH